MRYEITVHGKEGFEDNPVDFEPIIADNIHAAAREARRILGLRSVWAGGTEPFVAKVTVCALDGPSATVTMPVECAVRDVN